MNYNVGDKVKFSQDPTSNYDNKVRVIKSREFSLWHTTEYSYRLDDGLLYHFSCLIPATTIVSKELH